MKITPDRLVFLAAGCASAAAFMVAIVAGIRAHEPWAVPVLAGYTANLFLVLVLARRDHRA